MVNKQIFKKKKLYQFLRDYSSPGDLPHLSLSLPPPPIFSSTVIFTLTCFRLSRRSWTGVTNVLLVETTTALENSDTSGPRTVAK